MLVVLNLCMVWGLEGDDCKNKSAEKCEAEAGGQHDVARRKGCFEFGFGFVGHGFGFGGWKKRMCVGEPHPSVGYAKRLYVGLNILPVRRHIGFGSRIS